MFFAVYAIIILMVWLMKFMIQIAIAGIWFVACVLVLLATIFSGGKANVRYPRFPWWVL